ncbi:potassium transporter TrkA [Campylobacter sp. Marseille-Q3452]|uniref:Potassium transporter TrkA n=1 Tax=Campylobacter massiliensis TaxID=2762557 RepID=A0A842JA56_9BACT|nr:potassium transporter TrkA [Campylobacter massiliensis]MBC2882982.1 potassium transporter TrkA [Campylobacter massiliensis]
MNFKLLAVYGAFEALLLLGSAVFGRAWFYSSQVAFAGSLLVLAATFRAYKKRVENGVRDYDASADDDIDEWGENHEEFPDRPVEAKFDEHDPRREDTKRLDELNLNDENERAKFDEQNLSDADQSGGLNLSLANESNLSKSNQNSETKPSKKQNFARNLKQNSPNYFTAFVPFRLIAYAVLVVGFLALKRQDNLDIAAFLIALAAMPAGALIYGVKSNEK